MRNALNGLVVNLEVVRAQIAASGVSVEPFMSQALEQSEESVRLAESANALLTLLVGAVGPGGELRCSTVGDNALKIDGGSDAERLANGLRPLAARRVFSVEQTGPTVILRIPDDRPENELTNE